jgi:hypothetical protein
MTTNRSCITVMPPVPLARGTSEAGNRASGANPMNIRCRSYVVEKDGGGLLGRCTIELVDLGLIAFDCQHLDLDGWVIVQLPNLETGEPALDFYELKAEEDFQRSALAAVREFSAAPK